MDRSTGNKAASSVVQPWFVVAALVVGGAYAIGTTDPPPAMQAKLQPPTGGIGGTMKTLDEIEPRTPISDRFLDTQAGATFVIDQPGSYYLPGDLFVGTNQIGVKVMAAPVTIDLMGHTIDGMNLSNDLIHVDPLADRVVIKNGTLRRSGERGIDSYADTVHIEMVEVVETRRSGISLDTGRAATLRDVTVADTGTASGADRDGIRLVGPGAVRARDIDVTGAGGNGIATGSGTVLTLVDAFVADTGISGVSAGDKAIVRSVRVENSNSHGIVTGADATVEDCHVDAPRGNGIQAGSRSRVEKNRVYVHEASAAPLGAGVMLIGDDAIVCHNVTNGGGSAFFGIRLNGSRNLLSCNRNYANAGFSLSSGNMVGNILTSVASYNSNQDPDANFDL
ncbi:MAG: hypothetical protein Tsb0013_11770 [Phycisphaerales bacterium]